MEDNFFAKVTQGLELGQQLRDQDQQSQARAFALQQAQAQAAREDQFRNAVPAYLSGGENALAGIYGSAPGAPQRSQAQAASELFRADPQRAIQLQELQARQNEFALQQHKQQVELEREQFRQAYEYGTHILGSAAPKKLVEIQQSNSPLAKKLLQIYQENGVDFSSLTDEQFKDQVREMTDQFRIKAGIAQPEKFKDERDASGALLQRSTTTGQLKEITKPEKATKTAAQADMAPDELDYAAGTVMLDPARMKDFASFGAAGQAKRDAINKAVTSKLKDSGMSASDLARMRSNFTAQRGSIQKLQAQANAVDSFEGLARANGQRLLDLIDKVDDTGIPFIEGITRHAKKGLGDVDAAEAQSVLTTFQTEAARILNNPGLTGVLSDSARNDIKKVVGGDLSSAQTKRVVNRLFLEFDLRKSFIDKEIGKAGQSMAPQLGEIPGQPAQQPPTPTATPPVSKSYTHKSGAKVEILN